MEYLFERFKLTDENLQGEVSRVISAFHKIDQSYSDNSTIVLVGNPDNPDEYVQGLKLLEENSIITYKKIQMRKSELLYHVQVVNRYNLELLNRELGILRRRPERLIVERAAVLPRVPNITYYELSTGKILINGKSNTLKKTNKKLFDALFVAYPGYAERGELLKIVGVGKRDDSPSSKIALNEAFSNLRKACGVTARIIGLSSQGGRLNGRAYPLSAQLPHRIFNR